MSIVSPLRHRLRTTATIGRIVALSGLCLVLTAASATAGPGVSGWCPTLLAPPAADGARATPLTPTEASYRVEMLGTVAVGTLELRYEHAGAEAIRASWISSSPAGVELDGLALIDEGGERTTLELERAADDNERRGATKKTATARASAGRRAAPRSRAAVGIELPAESAITIELAFHATARFTDDRFNATFPAVGGNCPAAPGHSAARALAVPTDLQLTIRHDEPIVELDSPSHEVLHDFLGDRTEVELVAADTLGDRAFELRYTLGRFDEPSLTGFSGPMVDGEQDVIVVFAPAAHTSSASVRDKDVLFVVDTSGSMRGPKIVQARIALIDALGMLRENDRFNIIEFDSDVTTSFEQPTTFGAAALGDASAWLEQLPADGSTRLFPALSVALHQAATPGNHRLIVLLTDGRIGDETTAMSFLDQHLGDARFFVVGIGQDADADAVHRMAEHGRGAAAFAAEPAQLADALAQLFSGVAQPVAWNLSIDWGAAELVEMQPARLPDLYGGRPVTVRARLRGSLDAGVRIDVETTDGSRTYESDVSRAALPGRRQDAD